ncbi:MAG: tRNA 2-thiouridine(34) synthase MnmA [Candidatus Doudnabacteria bacterium]|nr:tRNA 2-thiouridine(34) synthase MnmA [Candidatus Doudnabacteria bacterium]
MQKKPKVLMALSGGIDSAVSAWLLLKQGYEVEAAFMKNWTSQEGLLKNECPWLEDRREALRVAAFLGIPLYTLDFEKEYQNNVMGYFFKEYKAGHTPNPDVMCNKEIKFKMLYNWAMKKGFDYLATGHYARVYASEKSNIKNQILKNKNNSFSTDHYSLVRSADEFKDQTYFIYNIKKEQLPHVLFPIGGMKKEKVRAMARKIGLPNAERRESMGLCFVGKIRLKDFLEQKLKVKKGQIFDQDGKKIGTHEGLHNYTIGQRQGIKVGGGGPYFVYAKDLAKNRLYVINNPEDERLYTKEVQLHSMNWLAVGYPLPATGYQLKGRYRHQGELVPLKITHVKKDLYNVKFKHPQKAVASGQSLVLYKGKVCVGGGVIA